jgi:hypothetical protein
MYAEEGTDLSRSVFTIPVPCSLRQLHPAGPVGHPNKDAKTVHAKTAASILLYRLIGRFEIAFTRLGSTPAPILHDRSRINSIQRTQILYPFPIN